MRRALPLALLLAVVLAGCSSDAPGTLPTASAATNPALPTATPATASPSAATSLRFVVASDAHLGEPKAPGDPFPDFVAAVNRLHAQEPVDFVVVNGDLTHGGVAAQQRAKASLDALAVPYLVTQGNHDELTPAQWRSVWGSEPDLVRRFGDLSVVLANTSDAAGGYLCPDLPKLTRHLAGEAEQSDVLVFFHVPAKKWTKYDVDCPDVRQVLSDTPNLRAVFNGHDHDQAGIKVTGGVDYLFDSHLGGHWGTPQPGFRLATLTGTSLTTGIVHLDGSAEPEVTLNW